MLGYRLSDKEFDTLLQELFDEELIYFDTYQYVYLRKYFKAEESIAINLYRLNNRINFPEEILKYLEEEKYKSKFEFAEAQKEAIDFSISNQLTLIHGPAGAGKTTVLQKITSLYEDIHILQEILKETQSKTSKKQEKEINIMEELQKRKELKDGKQDFMILAAPTGKAKERMKESTDTQLQPFIPC